jgi:hypothetical protein
MTVFLKYYQARPRKQALQLQARKTKLLMSHMHYIGKLRNCNDCTY